MRNSIIALIVFASPAWGAGNYSEALCDSPPASVTCECSEPLTKNDGTFTKAFKPTSIKGCSIQGASIGTSGFDFVPASSVSTLTGQPGTNITVGGDGFVGRAFGGTTIIHDNYSNRDFTDGTFCIRTYQRWHPEWDCNDDCNIKGPRFEDHAAGPHLGFETGWSTNNSNGEFLRLNLGTYWFSDISNCNTSTGCINNGGLMPRNPDGGDDITFEDHQTGWARMEFCFDHNPPAAKAYTGLPYPGPDHVYARARMTMITGPYAGKVQYFGPAFGPNATPTIHPGENAHLFTNFVSSGFSPTRGDSYVSYATVMIKRPADPSWWIGPAIEVEESSPSTEPSDSSLPTATPFPTPTPTPTAVPGGNSNPATPLPTPTPTPTATAVADGAGGAPSDQLTFGVESGCPGSENPDPAILLCDDFDGGGSIGDRWNAYNDAGGSYLPVAGVGLNGSTAMRASWSPGQVNAGTISIGLGQLPPFYLGADPAGENWKHVVSPDSKFREIYFRQYLKLGDGWSGVPRKWSRIRVLSDPKPGDTPHPTAFQGHLWQQINTANSGTIGALYWNNSRGVDENGTVIDTGNSTGTAIWLAQTRGSIVIWDDYPSGSDWYCIEGHVRLNDPGQSNGIEEFWVDGVLDAQRTDQNHIGSYTKYGINQIVFDNYWNEGSPQANELYRDNIVISTERIGCLPESPATGESGNEPIGKPGTPYVVGQ